MSVINFDKLMGWAGVRVADAAWESIGSEFPHFFIVGQETPTQGKTFRAWDVWRKVLGHDLPTDIQETGDCVGASMTDVINAMQCIEIALGDREKFEQTLISYVYAYSRVIVGKNQLKGGAGSVGSWMAKTVSAGNGGCLSKKFKDVPAYSGKLSDQWGDDKKYDGKSFRDYVDESDDHTFSGGARITDWSQLRDGVINGRLGTIASNRGYTMKPDKDGFHKPSGTWSHQMSIMALCDDPRQSWVGIKNQWGDQHGQIKDFETGELWPVGMLRVRREDFEKKHLTSSAECFVYSGLNGFVDLADDLEGLLI